MFFTAFALLSAGYPDPVAAPHEAVVCSRTMRFEDQYCDAVLIKKRTWTHADAAVAHETQARYALPGRAGFSFLAAANNWIAAGQPKKAVIAFDRALAAGLSGAERSDALAARKRAALLAGL